MHWAPIDGRLEGKIVGQDNGRCCFKDEHAADVMANKIRCSYGRPILGKVLKRMAAITLDYPKEFRANRLAPLILGLIIDAKS